ncbi:MAG: CBS domain-containing protein [Chloroflexi bacterium]|nr:CBS domain-containing protein [Chloroflexota bacterium]
MDGKSVAEVMHHGVITCNPTTAIPEVARLMNEHDISAVVVVDDRELLAGIITRSDLVVLYGYDEMWPHLRADQVMITQVATVKPNDPAFKAAQEMRRRRIHRLVVVEPTARGERPRPIGVISMTDIVRDMSLA